MKKYLCGPSFRYELGETQMDGYIFDSIEELKSKHSCWEECGIVEIEFEKLPEDYSSHKWVVPEDLDWRKWEKIRIEENTRAEVPGTGKTADEIRREDSYEDTLQNKRIRRFSSGDTEENY